MKIIIFLALCAPALASAKAWRIAVISDMNGSYGSKTYEPALDAAIADIRAKGVDAVLSTGDMVAGQKSGLDYRGMWKAFLSHTSTPLASSSVPLLPSPGNHDASASAGFKRERDEYAAAWNALPVTRFNSGRDPSEQIQFLSGVKQNYPFYYAVTMGPALFIGLDATLPGQLPAAQFAWLKDVLERSAAFKVKIVFGHVPLFPFAFQRAHEHLAQGTLSNGFYKKFEDLLEEHEVDLFLSGHHHVFYPGQRHGHVRYVSVPLLGTGARNLLNKGGDKSVRAPQAFLYLDFDDTGAIEMRAIRSPQLTEIALDTLPKSISIPAKSTSDCVGCSSFPSAFFLNSSQRTVYDRW
jgi:3',5'-cyclic AMP phosphodiesterase CpdA